MRACQSFSSLTAFSIIARLLGAARQRKHFGYKNIFGLFGVEHRHREKALILLLRLLDRALQHIDCPQKTLCLPDKKVISQLLDNRLSLLVVIARKLQ